MQGLLVFDHLNDVIYTKYNNTFAVHINLFAIEEGFIKEPLKDVDNSIISDNTIIQIFSPIITSQRIMSCQFGNSYTSFQCRGGFNMCFDEYMGYLFVSVSSDDVPTIKKFLGKCITMVRYLCGPDICQLKDNKSKATLATRLIDTWTELYKNDQAIYVEAIEQLVVNSDLSSVVLQVLHKSVDKLVTMVECSKIHAIIFVKNTVFCLFSSKNAKELSPSDILFVNILSENVKNKDSDEKAEVESYQVLLDSSESYPCCLAHVVHVIPVCKEINLVYLLEIGNLAVSSSLYETFGYLHTMQLIQIQRDTETLLPAFENLETSMKRLIDALKKCKIQSIEFCFKLIVKKWDVIRKKYLEFIKTKSDESILRAETLALGLLENLKQLLALTSIDERTLYSNQKITKEVAAMVLNALMEYNDFLKVKTISNFTLGSDSLTFNKYLEEFPGLVHFIYVDRSSHRVTAPTVNLSLDKTNKLTKEKVWAMIHFSRNHLHEGNLSLMWKDNIFNYAYFLWFEDVNGTPLKPIVFPTNSSKALPLPGILGDDFYQKLKEVCFPKMSPLKIRCYELFCVHLGLVTSSCVLEHTRRLSATIWELRGMSEHPIDFL